MRDMTMILILLCAVIMPLPASAGSLDAPGAPSAGSGMPTLTDIYNQLDTGATSTPAGSFQEPAAGPTAGTGRSLTEIKAKLPSPDNTNGATTNDVLSGKTFWGLTAGQWGKDNGNNRTGSMPNNGAVTVYPGYTDQQIPAGYHNGSGTVVRIPPPGCRPGPAWSSADCESDCGNLFAAAAWQTTVSDPEAACINSCHDPALMASCIGDPTQCGCP